MTAARYIAAYRAPVPNVRFPLMAGAFAVLVSIVSFFAMLFAIRWLILGRMPQGIAMLGREVESLRERVQRLEAEAQRREQTPS